MTRAAEPRAQNPKITRVEGTFTLNDGTEHSFSIFKDGGWQQWSGNQAQIAKTVYAIQDMAQALTDYLISDYNDDSELDEVLTRAQNTDKLL